MLAAGFIALAVVVVDLAGHGLRTIGVWHLGVVVLGLLVGAVAGKGIGLAWAGYQWRRAVADAVAALSSHNPRPAGV